MSNLIQTIIKNAAAVAPELGMYDAQVVESKPDTVAFRSTSVKFADVVAKLTEKFGPPTDSNTFLFIHTVQWNFPNTGVATLTGVNSKSKRGVRLVLAKESAHV